VAAHHRDPGCSVMETVLSVSGLVFVLLLSLVI
jgi:hypothetical protein